MGTPLARSVSYSDTDIAALLGNHANDADLGWMVYHSGRTMAVPAGWPMSAK